MIENRAVGTNGDIHRCKHASQGKKVKQTPFFFFFFFVEKLIKICRVGRVNRVGREWSGYANQIPFFLGLSLLFLKCLSRTMASGVALGCTLALIIHLFHFHPQNVYFDEANGFLCTHKMSRDSRKTLHNNHVFVYKYLQ